MPKKREHEEKKKEKTFIWLGLRISFWVMVGLYITSLILNKFVSNMNTTLTSAPSIILWILIIIGIIQAISIIFTFVSSILNLKRYKEKAFAIVALVLSSLSILSLILEILIILGGGTLA